MVIKRLEVPKAAVKDLWEEILDFQILLVEWAYTSRNCKKKAFIILGGPKSTEIMVIDACINKKLNVVGLKLNTSRKKPLNLLNDKIYLLYTVVFPLGFPCNYA